MPGPLTGLRAFDLTIAGAGPRAGRMLAELGAEVIKIEPPGDGDVILRRPPTQRGWPVGYTHFNRGKKSIFLDLRDTEARQLAYKLIERSDIFLNNMRPGAAERLGLGYEDLTRLNQRLIYGYMSAWGREGPLAAWPGADPVVQVFSGWCAIQGQEGGTPEFGRYVGHLDDTGAVLLVGGVLQALIDRERTGLGQRVDVSLLGASLAVQTTRVVEHFAGQTLQPLGSASGTTAPHQAFLCGDRKYLAVGVVNDEQWRAFCGALGLAELAADPRFLTNADRVRNRRALEATLNEVFIKFPTNWWQILLERAHVPHGRFYDWEALRYHAQVLENNYISMVDVPHQGKLYLVNPPWEFHGSRPPDLNAPKPGEHTDEVRAWLKDIAQQQTPPPKASGPSPSDKSSNDHVSATPHKALNGILIVDVTQGFCGPHCSQLLADAGATVIKVEPPGGDYARHAGPLFIGDTSAAFCALNRNKQSIVLDLSREQDRHTLRELVATASVFLDDWRPGTAEALRLDYVSLRNLNPGLICCAITPFGERGPLKDREASELVIQAMTEYYGGLGRVGEAPVRMGADVASASTALYAFDALLAAMLQRERTGRGDRITVSQFGTLLYCRGTIWASQGDPDDWDGWAARPFYPPDYGYETKDGRVYFIILRGDEDLFDALMLDLGLEDYLADPRFQEGGRDAVGIGRYAAEVKPIWEGVFKTLTTAELTEVVQRNGGIIAPFHTYTSLFSDPKVAPLNLLATATAANGASYTTLNLPWAFSSLSNHLTGSVPGLGEHTSHVLSQLSTEARPAQLLTST